MTATVDYVALLDVWIVLKFPMAIPVQFKENATVNLDWYTVLTGIGAPYLGDDYLM